MTIIINTIEIMTIGVSVSLFLLFIYFFLLFFFSSSRYYYFLIIMFYYFCIYSVFNYLFLNYQHYRHQWFHKPTSPFRQSSSLSLLLSKHKKTHNSHKSNKKEKEINETKKMKKEKKRSKCCFELLHGCV